MKHVILAGGSGFLGTTITNVLLGRGFRVTCISRSGRAPKGAVALRWSDDVSQAVASAHAVVNLAGANVGARRWTAAYQREILTSRIDATRTLAKAIRSVECPPALINASAVGFYGDTTVDVNEGHPAGATFLATVTQRWEAETDVLRDVTRVALMRIGVVLDPMEGALAKLLGPIKMGLGGPLGSGRQWFPWIHRDDVVQAFLWAIDGNASGPYNLVAPQQVTMAEFVHAVGSVVHRPTVFGVPSGLLRLLLGAQADVVLHGQRVRPFRLEGDGFTWAYPRLIPALQHLLHGS